MARASKWSMTRWARAPLTKASSAWPDGVAWCYTVKLVGPCLQSTQHVCKGVRCTWPGLALATTADREELEWRASEVFGWVASGELKLRIGGTFPLAEAAEAHRQLESRLSTGKLLLIP